MLRYAERGGETISSIAADAASVGRSGYAYASAMMVAGVILVAVAVGLTIDNPAEERLGGVGADDAGRAGAVPRRPGPVQVGVGRRSMRAPVIAIGGTRGVRRVRRLGADQLVVMVGATLVVGTMTMLAVTADRA